MVMVQYSAEYQLILGLSRVRVMPYYSAEFSDSTRHILSLNKPPVSEHSNNLMFSKLALLQVFYALYWPVNAKKNCFVRYIF